MHAIRQFLSDSSFLNTLSPNARLEHSHHTLQQGGPRLDSRRDFLRKRCGGREPVNQRGCPGNAHWACSTRLCGQEASWQTGTAGTTEAALGTRAERVTGEDLEAPGLTGRDTVAGETGQSGSEVQAVGRTATPESAFPGEQAAEPGWSVQVGGCAVSTRTWSP